MADSQRYTLGGEPIVMRYDWALLIIGKRRVSLGMVTMSREYAWWLAGYQNDYAIAARIDILYRAVPLPLTGDISVPIVVELSR